MASEVTQQLLKALEAGNYNAKPGKLRQGCISAVFYDENGNEREGTEEEWDRLYEQANKDRAVYERMEKEREPR